MNGRLELTKPSNFEPSLLEHLPETYDLLRSANLVVHPFVSRVVLHGSRGLAGGYRPDSDIDLSLIVDAPFNESEFRAVVETTLQHWRASVDIDLAVIFDINNCELKCFEQRLWDSQICQMGGVDCFGLYKTQKGFTGTVMNAGIQVKLMYPCLKIWQRGKRFRIQQEKEQL